MIGRTLPHPLGQVSEARERRESLVSRLAAWAKTWWGREVVAAQDGHPVECRCPLCADQGWYSQE